MQNDAAMLQCSNEYCKARNDQTDKFCQLCATPLIKRYLWAVEEIEAYQIGSLVGDRYLLKSNRILLDTKPGLLPETPFPEISDAIKPYLRLIPYQLHIPQVYGLVSLGERTAKKILLLEQAPISTEPLPVGLMPELTRAWKDATSMRQLNWLWQMATLWQPLWTEGVASSLLDPLNLRIEGSLIRLLELQPDQAPPTLAQLGQVWSQLVATSQPSITEFLGQLCHALVEREIQTIDKLISVLEQGLALLAPCVQSTITIATSTDKGPSRERNEDACYPTSGAIAIHTNNEPALAIVCDGIGGHEGGNVASNLAIETIQQQIQQLALNDSQLMLQPSAIN
jgi:protein phosphatase